MFQPDRKSRTFKIYPDPLSGEELEDFVNRVKHLPHFNLDYFAPVLSTEEYKELYAYCDQLGSHVLRYLGTCHIEDRIRYIEFLVRS